MKYNGLMSLAAQAMIYFNAKTKLYGHVVGDRAYTDPKPGTLEEKLHRALEDLYSGALDNELMGVVEEPQAIAGPPAALPQNPEPQRRGPGRPRKPENGQQQNGERHDRQ